MMKVVFLIISISIPSGNTRPLQTILSAIKVIGNTLSGQGNNNQLFNSKKSLQIHKDELKSRTLDKKAQISI